MSDLISRSEVNDVIDELEVYTCGRPNTMKSRNICFAVAKIYK